MDEGDNRTLGTQRWGLEPEGLGDKLEGSPCPDSIWESIWKVLLLFLWDPSVCRLWEPEEVQSDVPGDA